MAGDTVYTRFARAWESVNNPPLNSINPHFKSKYADLPSVVAAVKAACKENGLVYFAGFDEDEGGTYMYSWVMDKDGNKIELTRHFSLLPAATIQQLGSHITYTRRYLYLTDWTIVGDEDDDGNGAMPQQPQKAQPKPKPKAAAKKPQEKDVLAELWQECIDLGVKPSGLMSWYEAQGYGGIKLQNLTAIERKQVEAYLLDMRESIKQVNGL